MIWNTLSVLGRFLIYEVPCNGDHKNIMAPKLRNEIHFFDKISISTMRLATKCLLAEDVVDQQALIRFLFYFI